MEYAHKYKIPVKMVLVTFVTGLCVSVCSADSQWQATKLDLDPMPAHGIHPVNLCEGMVTDKKPRKMVDVSKPQLYEKFIDPAFGSTIRRITDVSSNAQGSKRVIKPMYSTIQSWNADESLLLLWQRGEGHQLFDGKTYKYIREVDISPSDLEQVFWHFTDPDILYYVVKYYGKNRRRLMRYHVSDDVNEVVHDFSNICGSKTALGAGGAVQMMSSDSDIIGLYCKSNRHRPPALNFYYRVSKDEIGASYIDGKGNNFRPGTTPQPAPSGKLFFKESKYVLDEDLKIVRTLSIAAVEHSSLGRMPNGNDAYFGVGFDRGPRRCENGSTIGSLVAHDMTNGKCYQIIGKDTGYIYPPSATHVSAVAYKNPGWVAVSSVGSRKRVNDGEDQRLLHQEIYLAYADPKKPQVCRVAHHRSWGKHSDRGYFAEPHVTMSPSGTRMLFASDWGNSGAVDTYVIELPAYNR